MTLTLVMVVVVVAMVVVRRQNRIHDYNSKHGQAIGSATVDEYASRQLHLAKQAPLTFVQ